VYGILLFVIGALALSAHAAAVSSADPMTITAYRATTHPMRYHLALPSGWTADHDWPVLVVIPDAARDFEANLARFASARRDRDLRYAYRTAGARDWTVTVVDSTGDVGSALSLDVDATGAAHIAYLDRTHLHLKYATTRRDVAVRAIDWSSAKSRYR
jgi:hypothetical protein